MNNSAKIILEMKGRSGHLVYRNGDKTAKLYVEISGVPDYHIILSTEDLMEWHQPKGEIIRRDEEDQILQAIIAWEEESGMKTDIPQWARNRVADIESAG